MSRFGVLLVCLLAVVPLGAQSPTRYQQMGRDVLKELIETDTTHSTGSTTVAAEKMGARLVAAGFPKADVVVVGGNQKGAETRGNLVARYRGTGARKPLLFIAHLDVVEARREDWSMDPFVLNEKDGYLYGRGTIDVKGGAATLVAAFARLRQEQWVPDRDLILALTADEEGGPDNGIAWLLANRRDLIAAEYTINVDSGGGELRDGKISALDVQAAEKIYASFSLTVKNRGGHSSLPTKDNAIYRLAAGLQRLAAFEFPVRLNDITRAYFERMAPLSGANAADMRAVAATPSSPAAAARLAKKSAFHNALLRTTCVATMLQAGHAENALPQTAQATVNCRLLPTDDASGRSGDPRAGPRRSRDRRGADRHADPKSAFAACDRTPGGDRHGCQGGLGEHAARSDHSLHGDWRNRRTPAAERGHSRLRRHWDRRQSRRRPCAREGRARVDQVVQRRPGVCVSVNPGAREQSQSWRGK